MVVTFKSCDRDVVRLQPDISFLLPHIQIMSSLVENIRGDYSQDS